IRFEKQDLPFAEPLDTITWKARDAKEMPAFGVCSRVKASGAAVEGTFADGSPAITRRKAGKGSAVYCGFLPGLTYLEPAYPLLPMDGGASADSMTHFLPTKFNDLAAALIESPAADLELPVRCPTGLVETTVVQAKQGTLIPLINWGSQTIKGLKVTVRID